MQKTKVKSLQRVSLFVLQIQNCWKHRYERMCELVHVCTCLISVTQRQQNSFLWGENWAYAVSRYLNIEIHGYIEVMLLQSVHSILAERVSCTFTRNRLKNNGRNWRQHMPWRQLSLWSRGHNIWINRLESFVHIMDVALDWLICLLNRSLLVILRDACSCVPHFYRVLQGSFSDPILAYNLATYSVLLVFAETWHQAHSFIICCPFLTVAVHCILISASEPNTAVITKLCCQAINISRHITQTLAPFTHSDLSLRYSKNPCGLTNTSTNSQWINPQVHGGQAINQDVNWKVHALGIKQRSFQNISDSHK